MITSLTIHRTKCRKTSRKPNTTVFLDGFSVTFQIPMNPKDQEKTTFTCPYGTFAYRRMPFGLCNAPGTFQRCMMAIFHDMIEKTMEVFMDDFFVFGDSFSTCLAHLEKMLKRCEDTNLSLNWEKSHFMTIQPLSISLPRRMLRQDSCGGSYCSKNLILKFETKKEQKILLQIFFQTGNLSHQDKFENKEINEAFPLETLGSIALKDDSTPWFADFANYHAGKFIVKGDCRPREELNSSKM
ncbi:reverse transcriptase domain-containing protein [Tanacetum coccineum]